MVPTLLLFLVALIGFASGWAVGAFVVRSRADRQRGQQIRSDHVRFARLEAAATLANTRNETLESQVATLTERVVSAEAELAAAQAVLDAERVTHAEKLAMLDEAQTQFRDAFATLSNEALDANAQRFLELAEGRMATARAEAAGDMEQRRQAVDHLVGPLREVLGKVEAQLREIELTRQDAYSSLAAQVGEMRTTNADLRRETANLVSALRTPHTRGRWGELQLRRVVEMAGMVAHTDFSEQTTVFGPGGAIDGAKRPDLVVHLPGERALVVDAKVPLSAYLAALDAADENDRVLRLKDHARRVRHHIDSLSAKAYWDQFPTAPDFVVLFIPGDAILAAACEQEPDLFEHGIGNRVLLATPSTLIALLKSAAYGWRQDAMADNARQVCELGRLLHDRLATMGEHMSQVGRALERSVEAYNRQVGSFEGRVLVTARKFVDLEVAEAELPELAPIEHVTRTLSAPELALDYGIEPADTDEPETRSLSA